MSDTHHHSEDIELAQLERELSGAVRAARFTARELSLGDVWKSVERSDVSGASQGTEYAGVLPHASAQYNSQPIIRRIAGRVFPALATRTDVNRGVFSAGTLPRWVGYATLTCIAGFAAWQVSQLSNSGDAASKAYTTYTTRPGQRATLALIDGSQVTLGPATTLRLLSTTKSDIGITAEVAGEVLFRVMHSGQRPFTVIARGIQTRVLGTEFIVRAYDDSNVRIVVRDGRVAVQTPLFTSASSVVVNAGEAVSATLSTPPIVEPVSDLSADFAWANGELVLRDMPLGDALVQLSRWYGIEFKVVDSKLLKSRIDASFPSSFSKVPIEILVRTIGARAQYIPGAVILSLEE